MSECIRSGYLPLWNPYINFGFPQYGDMSGGYWSPITWLISATTGYNAYTFTIETLFYIFIGGLGIYKLLAHWKLNKDVRLIAAIAFMCSGYNVGHLQHFNWLSGAAFLPWCMWSYLQSLKKFSWKNVLLNVLLFYLFISSAHPGLIISAGYFFIALLMFTVYDNFKKKKDDKLDSKKNIFKTHLSTTILLLLLSSGMIVGYMDFLPHFVRAEKISIESALTYPTTLKSWVSIILPFATVKNDALYNTDISMRNCYMSLTMLLFLLYSIITQKNRWQIFFLITGSLFALLSTGGIFKIFAYKFLPFIGYVRLNGEFRIFALLCFIIAASISLDHFFSEKKIFAGKIKWIYYSLEILLFIAILSGLMKTFQQKESVLFETGKILEQSGFSLKLKTLIDSISFYDTIWMQGIIQLFILWFIKWCLRYQNLRLLRNIVVADMILATLMNVPFTGAGKISVSQVQEILSRSPKGIVIPALQNISKIDTLSVYEKNIVGDWTMYNKQIGTVREVLYPVELSNTYAYFENKGRGGFEADDQPFVFTFGNLKRDSIQNLQIVHFSPNKIDIAINTPGGRNIAYLQNYYPHWFYQSGNIKKDVNKFGTNFMSAPVSKDHKMISFSFEPTKVIYAMTVSLAALIIIITILIIKWKED